ncbi:hypothetical protein B0H11DRAFT_2252061 [Mycena galericulata]|nr:hypothetical protein B0H11DRAFT_2252061 [Mycena galericulata]
MVPTGEFIIADGFITIVIINILKLSLILCHARSILSRNFHSFHQNEHPRHWSRRCPRRSSADRRWNHGIIRLEAPHPETAAAHPNILDEWGPDVDPPAPVPVMAPAAHAPTMSDASTGPLLATSWERDRPELECRDDPRSTMRSPTGSMSQYGGSVA